MKFTITMKDPDGVSDSLDEAAREAAALVTGIDEDERKAMAESKRDKFYNLMGKWFRYGEYLDVEIDTDAGTCTVLARK